MNCDLKHILLQKQAAINWPITKCHSWSLPKIPLGITRNPQIPSARICTSAISFFLKQKNAEYKPSAKSSQDNKWGTMQNIYPSKNLRPSHFCREGCQQYKYQQSKHPPLTTHFRMLTISVQYSYHQLSVTRNQILYKSCVQTFIFA